MEPEGPLTTSVIGSHALPGWLHYALEGVRQGKFGQTDLKELRDDAVRIAIRDMEEAGVDVVTDGEMRRHEFISGFYDSLMGLEVLEPTRKLGLDARDFIAPMKKVGKITAPRGLGIVEEFKFTREHTDRPIKVTCPGPLTMTLYLDRATPRTSVDEAAWELSRIINQELRRLVEAGANFIQIDEPSYNRRPDDKTFFIDMFNKTISGVNAKIGLHICFGNYRSRPASLGARRRFAPIFPEVLDAKCHQIALEFANREMAEADLWKKYPNDKELGAGLIDVKNEYVERPEDVAARIRTVLEYVDANKLWINPDCGVSQLSRSIALEKLKVMVSGTRLVKKELGIQD